MQKKILHVYKTFSPETRGGVEKVIHQLSQDMSKYGFESKVICLTSGKKKLVEEFENIKVIRYPSTLNFASCPISIPMLFSFRKESKWADIIHYHYPWPFGDLLSMFVPDEKKQIATYHSDIVKQRLLKRFYYPLEQCFLRKLDKIIATSPVYAQSSKNLQKFKNKVDIVDLGINPDDYPKPNRLKSNEIKKKYGRFILFIGQLRYYKGLHLLIPAMKGLDVNLIIIGTGTEEKKLKHLCKKEKIYNVYFLGQLEEEDKVNFLDSCYAFALTSHLRSEAFGISLLEACIFSKPIISCQIGTGTEYINQNGETGFVVYPDVKSIRSSIVKLLCEPDIAKKMGKAARKRFETKFTSEIMVKEMVKLIEKL